MATLLNRQTNEKVMLRADHTFGRDQQTNITALQGVTASRNHAVISWDGDKWCLRDLSTNGSFINDNLIKLSSRPLEDFAKIKFGDESLEIWEVLDLDPPATCLIPVDTSLPQIYLYDVEIISVEDKEFIVYLGEDGQWYLDADNEISILKPGPVKLGSTYWTFIDSRPSEATTKINVGPSSSDIYFNFKANKNEEHVSLKLLFNNSPVNLGERNHHYLLLLLARQRLSDQEKDMNDSEQGWIKKDVLVKMLGMAEQHINIQIWRFRKQVADTLPDSAVLNQIIERRPGELRFAHSNIKIEGGFYNQDKAM